MGSIYKALMRATEERQAVRRLTGLSESEQPGCGTSPRDADEDLVDLIASIESLSILPRKKTIQFLGSHDGSLSAPLARRFARTCAFSLDLPVLFAEPEARSKRLERLSFLDPLSERFVVSRRMKDFDDTISPAQDRNLFTCPFSAVMRIWSGDESPESSDAAWLRTKDRFDLIVLAAEPAVTSSGTCPIDPRVDAVILVFESEKTDLQSSSPTGDLCLASVLEQIAQGLWCPNQTLSCLDVPLLVLTRPADATKEPDETA